ncbi:MAG TPA: FAD-binding oxidoreductase [Phycisphaerales bacterium]|nr:FAD-binding oxidoreductase [Phycisphaerales bacterium]
MTVSQWKRTQRMGRAQCDAIVVGAGICGLSMAVHLRRRGLSVMVVDRRSAGSGASTRNAGFLMRGCADNYALAVKEYGRARAKALWKLTEENLAGLRREGISALPGVRDVPSVLLALEEGELRELRESVTLMSEDGFEVEWQESGTDSAWRSGVALGGLVNPRDASCNSREVIEHIAGVAKGLGAVVHEHQEVFAIDAAGSGLVTRTTDAMIESGRVVLCTNAFTPLLVPQLQGVVTPRRGQMLAMEPRGLRLDASYYANRGSEYFRQAADGTIVVGGCRTYHAEREVGYEDRVTPWVQRDIERFASLMLGIELDDVQARVTARWAGTMGFTPHHLPVITRVPVPGECATAAVHAVKDAPPHENLWFVGGFTGHGMSMAYRTSEVACGVMVRGQENVFGVP